MALKLTLRSGPRRLVWFSAGAASAVAAKLTLEAHSRGRIVVAYCDTGSEHPDNERFIQDCESWLGIKVTRLRSDKYRDIWQVFKERRYLVGPKGALCTTEMKKIPRFKFQRPDDVQVFGYTVDEKHRADRFRADNFDVTLETPLIDNGLGKSDCLALIERAGIRLPAMYLLGYKNNNCIGCVKGGAGYWNKIRRDFPDVFQRMSGLERELNVSLIRSKKEGRVFLDELDPEAGRYEADDIECSLLCSSTAAAWGK